MVMETIIIPIIILDTDTEVFMAINSIEDMLVPPTPEVMDTILMLIPQEADVQHRTILEETVPKTSTIA